MQGNLKLDNYNYDVFFSKDDCFKNLTKSTSEGHTFKLYILNNEGNYMIYDVVFTTLPVLKINQESENDGIMEGEMCLWPSNSTQGDRYKKEKSQITWHVRGDTTKNLNKKPYKLSLKDKKGNKKNIDLLGLGSDDDWILNAMYVDDSKIREKLFMALWNEMCENANYNHKMSNGKYIELVIDGHYKGLYLLQNRIDKKYLNLSDKDILLKGKRIKGIDSGMPDEYEVKYSPFSSQNTYKIVSRLWNEESYSCAQKQNIIDVYLFLQFSVAVDNTGYMNMYYIFEKDGDDYIFSMLPWDTDLTFGLTWNDLYVVDYENMVKNSLSRKEIEILINEYPELKCEISQRWIELRNTVLSKENILIKIQNLDQQIKSSGAYDRDFRIWDFFCGDNDPVGNITDFVEERIDWMDNKYAK